MFSQRAWMLFSALSAIPGSHLGPCPAILKSELANVASFPREMEDTAEVQRG